MAVGTAIGLGSAALIGSIVNAVSQDRTNKQMMSYQTSEREAAQEYNNPVNQKQRLESAGINPYFALGNIDAGNTTAQTSPQLQAPQFGDIFKNLANGISEGYDVYQHEQQTQAMQLGIEQQKVDTRYKLTEKLLQLNEQRLKIEGMNIDNSSKRKQLDFLDRQIQSLQLDIDATKADYDEKRKTVVAQRKLAEADEKRARLSADYQEWFNGFQKDYGPAQMAELRSIVANNMSAVALNRSLSAKAAAEKTVAEAQEKGIRIDNFQKNKINWMYREQLRLANQYQTYTNDNFWKTKFLDVFGSGAVAAGGAYLGAKGAKGAKPLPPNPVRGFSR